jgi:hypothetical protein
LHGRVQFRLWQTAWLLVGPLVAYAGMAVGEITRLGASDPNLVDQAVAGWFIILFVIGLRNSWDLLVEAGASATTSASAHRG